MKTLLLFFAGGILTLTPALSRGEDCTIGGCHASLKKLAYPHQPIAAGECGSCHLQRGPAHPQTGVKNFELVAAGSKLCFRCHPPLGTKKTVHPPARSGECLACHKPHGAENRFLLDSGDDLSALCFDCHEDAPFRKTVVHGPAATGVCSRCHDPHESDRAFLLLATPREVCLECHQDFAEEMAKAKSIHSPVRDLPCTSCHTPHASTNRFLIQKPMPDLCLGCHGALAEAMTEAATPHPPVRQEKSCGNCHSTHFSQGRNLLASDEKSLCLSCHGGQLKGSRLKNIEKELKAGKLLHGPVAKGECSACHQPHGSDHFRLLAGRYPASLYIRFEEGTYDLCLGCHQKNLLRFKDTTIYTEFRNGELNLHRLHAVGPKGRSCRFCHAAHAGDGEKLTTRRGFPFGSWIVPVRLERTATGGSCSPGCHRPLQYDREKPIKYESITVKPN